MEALAVLLALGVLCYFLVAPAVAWYRSKEAQKEVSDLRQAVEKLRIEVVMLRAQRPAPQPIAYKEELPPVTVFTESEQVEKSVPPTPIPVPIQLPISAPSVPPPLPPEAIKPPVVAQQPVQATPPLPQPIKTLRAPEISLEQFLGVKLFAWLGGLALFLGIVFFVKYAFERNLISPALRTGIGFVIGGGLVTTGIIMRRSRAYAVLAQTLTATGVLILYGVTYAAHALYHFPAFGSLSTFAYMSLITAGAFVLAVRMDAPVVAVLGMAGGFLTPILVNTGHDNPWGLFSYVLLIDLGLIAVTQKRGWNYLIACGAAGTLLLEMGWFGAWFIKGEYHLSAKVWIPIVIHTFFPAFFAVTNWGLDRDAKQKKQPASLLPAMGGMILAVWSFAVAFIFLNHEFITSRPIVLNGFLFAINLAVFLQIWVQPRIAPAQWLAALFSFVHLAVWSSLRLTDATLIPALVSYLIFGLMHTGFALLAMKKRPETMQAQRHGIWVGPVAVLLVLAPMFALDSVPWIIWPAVLLINLMTIAVAAVTLSLAPVLASLFVTMLALGAWLLLMDSVTSSWSFLTTVGGFALVFAAAGAVLSARMRLQLGGGKRQGSDWLFSLEGMLPMASAILPFVLLIIATHKLALSNPTPIFTMGILLSLGLLILMRLSRIAELGLTALICMWFLEQTWLNLHPQVTQPVLVLIWFIGVAALFASYPFVWHRQLQKVALPWVTSACSWLLQGYLIYRVCEKIPALEGGMGLVPALLAVPALLSLYTLIKMPKSEGVDVRNTQLAWFGGVALAFITLIFPIQFKQQWITLGWALEGAALCWLFTRVPHEGLRRVGLALLTTSFVRLTLNPAILAYQERSGTPIWNHFLYIYVVATVAMLAAAWWLAPPRDRMGDWNVRATLWTYAGILLFVLVNIQIADWFTPAGEVYINTQWGGDFARSMTFSIAWALFALSLLSLGFRLNTKGARYAGIGLMGVTLIKLFFHDLANIESIYRIGALIVVAIIALGSSFLYQRFYARQEKNL